MALCTRICPYPFFEVTPPGAAPGPPVKTGARVRRFRVCKNEIEIASCVPDLPPLQTKIKNRRQALVSRVKCEGELAGCWLCC